jgi:hypothetical protein
MKLRFHRLILTLVALLPMTVLAVVASVVLAQRDRATVQRDATECTISLVTAVDTEPGSSATTLQAPGHLAESRTTGRPSMPRPRACSQASRTGSR